MPDKPAHCGCVTMFFEKNAGLGETTTDGRRGLIHDSKNRRPIGGARMSYLPDAGANAIIANVIEGFDREIGSSIAAYYLIGSHVDGSAVPLSDVDMVGLLDPSAGHLLAQAGTLSRSFQHQHTRRQSSVGDTGSVALPWRERIGS